MATAVETLREIILKVLSSEKILEHTAQKTAKLFEELEIKCYKPQEFLNEIRQVRTLGNLLDIIEKIPGSSRVCRTTEKYKISEIVFKSDMECFRIICNFDWTKTWGISAVAQKLLWKMCKKSLKRQSDIESLVRCIVEKMKEKIESDEFPIILLTLIKHWGEHYIA